MYYGSALLYDLLRFTILVLTIEYYSLINSLDEWKYDNLKWINNSSRLCQRGNFQIKLHYFTVNIGFRNRGLFFKQVYATQIDDLYIALIYYHGSNEHAINIPHNKLRQLQNNMQVSPAVTCTLPCKQERREVITSPPILLHSPTESFSDEVNTKSNQSVQLSNSMQVVEPVPRMDNNTRQLNTLALHHKADQYPNLIYLLTTIPQLTMIFGYNDLIHEFRHLIRTHPFPQEVRLSLNLSFRTDTFYITPIYINYPIFSENPSFPVLVLIHEMKTSQAFNSLLSELVELMPELLDENFTFTSDENDLSVNSIKKYLPNANIHSPENTSCCSDNREIMNSLFPSKAIGPIEFIEIMKDHQKDILREISRSYKSKGKFRIQRQQLGMPATCLQNSFYQILKVHYIL